MGFTMDEWKSSLRVSGILGTYSVRGKARYLTMQNQPFSGATGDSPPHCIHSRGSSEHPPGRVRTCESGCVLQRVAPMGTEASFTPSTAPLVTLHSPI